jgi:hypothetical protein
VVGSRTTPKASHGIHESGCRRGSCTSSIRPTPSSAVHGPVLRTGLARRTDGR